VSGPSEPLPSVRALALSAKLAVGAALGGCAVVPPLPPATPEVPLAAWERPGATEAKVTPEPKGSSAPAPVLAKTADRVPTLEPPPAPAFAPPAATAESSIPGGSKCLGELGTRGIRFHATAPVLGIATPVVLDGTLDGIRFYAPDKRPFLADCRLILALTEVTPEWRALGVTEVRFSGAYVYKLTHPGRMSMHAYGLAVDLHAFHAGGSTLEVKHEFSRGESCRGNVPLLNRVLCGVRAHGSFKEHLGPDDNASHFDHFHLALKPLPGELADNLPLPARPEPRKRTRVSAKARSSPPRSGR
jgi:hypothetical protein